MVSDFIFHLRDNQAYLRDVKTTNKENKEKKKNVLELLFSHHPKQSCHISVKTI